MHEFQKFFGVGKQLCQLSIQGSNELYIGNVQRYCGLLTYSLLHRRNNEPIESKIYFDTVRLAPTIYHHHHNS